MTNQTETITADTITDDQIISLRDEAGAFGDLSQVRICDLALSGAMDARAECARVIRDAQGAS